MELRAIHNVLVVDDHKQILEAWKRGAGSRRRVLTASDAGTARQLAQQERFDLAIVDYRLDEHSSGLDLVRDLKHDTPDLRIVLCSGYLSIDLAVSAARAGADVVVCKPITFREILQRIGVGHGNGNGNGDGDGDADRPSPDDQTPTLARAEWEHIMRVLTDCNGNVSAAARLLGIYRSSLQRKLRKYAPRT